VRIGREAVYSFLSSRRCDERKKRSSPVSLHPQAAYPIPEETARVARAAVPNGNPLMVLRDELGMFAIDHEFAALFPPRGQPAVSPSRLFFITIVQFMEGLTDRQAADAVRSWYKIALRMVRSACRRRRPTGDSGGKSGLSSIHSASLRSEA
jgi:hypothetical protein